VSTVALIGGKGLLIHGFTRKLLSIPGKVTGAGKANTGTC
jgi:hypothetical protein